MKIFEIIYIVVIIIITIWISIEDFRERMIPNMSVILLGLLGIVKIIICKSLQNGQISIISESLLPHTVDGRVCPLSLISIAMGILFGIVVFLIPAVIKKAGFGDVKLAAVIGLNVGIHGMMYTIVFMGIGAIIYFIVVSVKKKTFNLKMTIPLGPFLMIGMIAYLAL